MCARITWSLLRYPDETEFAQRILADLAGWMERRQHVWLEPPAFQRLSEIHVPTLIVVRGPLEFNAPLIELSSTSSMRSTSHRTSEVDTLRRYGTETYTTLQNLHPWQQAGVHWRFRPE